MSQCMKPVEPVKINIKYVAVQIKQKISQFLKSCFYQVIVIYFLMSSCTETRCRMQSVMINRALCHI